MVGGACNWKVIYFEVVVDSRKPACEFLSNKLGGLFLFYFIIFFILHKFENLLFFLKKEKKKRILKSYS